MGKYEYPQKLIEYLTELESSGYEIITTHSADGTMWIAFEDKK